MAPIDRKTLRGLRVAGARPGDADHPGVRVPADLLRRDSRPRTDGHRRRPPGGTDTRRHHRSRSSAIVSDRFPTRWGRRKPWILVGGILAAIALVQLFQPPAEVTTAHLLIWSVALYLGWTLIAVPYTAWGAELSPDYNERSRITGAREAMMIVGIIGAELHAGDRDGHGLRSATGAGGGGVARHCHRRAGDRAAALAGSRDGRARSGQAGRRGGNAGRVARDPAQQALCPPAFGLVHQRAGERAAGRSVSALPPARPRRRRGGARGPDPGLFRRRRRRHTALAAAQRPHRTSIGHGAPP